MLPKLTKMLNVPDTLSSSAFEINEQEHWARVIDTSITMRFSGRPTLTVTSHDIFILLTSLTYMRSLEPEFDRFILLTDRRCFELARVNNYST